MKIFLASAALLLGLGCAPKAAVIENERDPFAPEERGSTRSALLGVTVGVLVPGESDERLLVGNEQLHNGSQVALLVRTTRSAYLNAVMISPSGKPATLFPDAGYNQIPGGCWVRIPSRGWLTLESPVGVENVRVLASARPLAQADPRLCQTLNICNAPVQPVRQLPCAAATERGLRDPRGLVPMIEHAKDDGSGVASVMVALQHVL